jgi:hypothetical protein
MVIFGKFARLTAAGSVALLVFAIGVLAQARAADAVFPAGSRVGLVPPPGMVVAEAFDGFADPNKDAAILIATLPAAAYPQLDKSMDAEALKKQGLNLEKREPIQLSFGKGFLLTGRLVADKVHYRKWLLVAPASDFTALISVQVPDDDPAYSDRVVREALTTLAARPQVPEAEQLSLLPFAVGDLAGFHIDAVLRGRALLLSDAPIPSNPAKDNSGDTGMVARMFIAAIPGGPQDINQHANFARLSFNEIGGIKDVQISISEPLRINGQSGYQTMAQAKDAQSGTDLMVVQWLRFGGEGYLQMVGLAPAGDNWTAVLARLRAVRDGIETK